MLLGVCKLRKASKCLLVYPIFPSFRQTVEGFHSFLLHSTIHRSLAYAGLQLNFRRLRQRTRTLPQYCSFCRTLILAFLLSRGLQGISFCFFLPWKAFIRFRSLETNTVIHRFTLTTIEEGSPSFFVEEV